MHLLTDLFSLRLAPTLGREVFAQALTLVCVVVLALVLADDPLIAYGLPAVLALYAAVRVAAVAVRGSGGERPDPSSDPVPDRNR
ncbi:hypothetical protein IDM40_22605 [Nocardiopsis sp. HNM0947]|uniref:Uncharacterized protein n=1 Tax=Nocardiopsis coralli TaxID=2772213 RepID=A0ABR9PCA9_9ACTN|nr:hypothetical protein [Nocardiopsis coralli]MBE3001461.1 hypothetical protein [Nocardiopsis coralli]